MIHQANTLQTLNQRKLVMKDQTQSIMCALMFHFFDRKWTSQAAASRSLNPRGPRRVRSASAF